MDRVDNLISLEERRRQLGGEHMQQGLLAESQSSGYAQPYVEKQLHQESLEKKIVSLEKDIVEIKEMLQKYFGLDNLFTGIIDLKDISYDKAKKKIAEYFRKNDGKEIGYEELIEELKIEPKLVVYACNELLSEGKIG